MKRKRNGRPLVTVYELDDTFLTSPDVNYKEFLKADSDWLNYVAANRQGIYCGPLYDIVSGPVANDRTILVVNDYLSGAIPFETAVMLLETAKLKDQYAFLTYRGLSALRFKGVIEGGQTA